MCVFEREKERGFPEEVASMYSTLPGLSPTPMCPNLLLLFFAVVVSLLPPPLPNSLPSSPFKVRHNPLSLSLSLSVVPLNVIQNKSKVKDVPSVLVHTKLKVRRI